MIVVVLEEKDYMKWMASKKMETFKDKYFAVAAPAEEEAPSEEEPVVEEVAEVVK